VSLSSGSGNPVRVHLFRGRADGTLDAKTTFDTHLTIAPHASTRVHDGALEILIGDRSGRLSILRIATGGVGVTTLEAGPGIDLSAIFADVNGDGHADIVDTNDGDSGESPFEWIFVTLAKPDGGFLERRQLQRPRKLAFPSELHAGDFDGDGRLDVVTANNDRTVSVILNGGRCARRRAVRH